MKKYITRQEAAKMLSVDPQTVSNLVERGIIGGRKKKVNNQVQVVRADVEAVLNEYEELPGDLSRIALLKSELKEKKDALRKDVERMLQDVGDVRLVFNTVKLILCNAIEQNKCCLNEREKRMADMMISDGRMYMSLREASEEFLVTRERTRQLVNKMMVKVLDGMEYQRDREQALVDEIKQLKAEKSADEFRKKAKAECETKGFANDVFAKAVNELPLSVRSLNCLRSEGIYTLAELVVMPEREMMKYRNFGKRSLNEIKDLLDDMGLRLGMSVEDVLETVKYKNVPDTIYLQTGLDFPETGGMEIDFEQLREVTWSQDKVNDGDIEYKLVTKEYKEK